LLLQQLGFRIPELLHNLRIVDERFEHVCRKLDAAAGFGSAGQFAIEIEKRRHLGVPRRWAMHGSGLAGAGLFSSETPKILVGCSSISIR
jgi:hypothetical protein